MRKLITLIAITTTISLTAVGQKKDTTKPVVVDTVYILAKPEMQFVQSLLRSNTISVNGKQLTFDEMLQLIQQLESRVYFLPRKEQSKK